MGNQCCSESADAGSQEEPWVVPQALHWSARSDPPCTRAVARRVSGRAGDHQHEAAVSATGGAANGDAVGAAGVQDRLAATALPTVPFRCPGAEEELQDRFAPTEVQLAKAFAQVLPFDGVVLEDFDLGRPRCSLSRQAKAILRRVAEVLKESPATCVRVQGFARGPRNIKSSLLSLSRARLVKEALEQEGCLNRIVAQGLGYVDDLGPRCELAACEADEAVAVERQVAELETSLPFQLERACAFDFTFSADGENKDPCELTVSSAANVEQVAKVLADSPMTCVRIDGLRGLGDRAGATAEGCAAGPEAAAASLLALRRARSLKEALLRCGCTNRIAVRASGVVNDRGPRCELTQCSDEEVSAIEAEVACQERQWRLEAVLGLELPFEGVLMRTFQPEGHVCQLKPRGKTHLLQVAAALREHPEQCIRITGFTGPPRSPKGVVLSLARARFLRQALQEEGCSNQMAAIGYGCDGGGARSVLSLCLPDEVARIEVEAAALEAEAKAAVSKRRDMAMTFVDAAGVEASAGLGLLVVFRSQPLGVVFSQGVSPVTVEKVDRRGLAESLGVRPGMLVAEVNGAPALGTPYETVRGLILSAMRPLPQEV